MNQQKEILAWLKSFTVNQIKSILTIKNPSNIEFIKKILTCKKQIKPIDLISHGFAEPRFNDDRGFYLRENFRYKKRKQQKKIMQKELLQNITVSRINPWSLSVKKEYIKSGELSKCMLLFSDDQIFNVFQLKQMHVKLDSQQNRQFAWFDPKNQHSFADWLLHLFELEIMSAYYNHKQTKNSPTNKFNHFNYAQQHISEEFIQQKIQYIINFFYEKKYNGKYAKKSCKNQVFICRQEIEQDGVLEISKQQIPYLIIRCLQKFQNQSMDQDETIFEYEWWTEDRKSKTNRLLQELCRIVIRMFNQFDFQMKTKQIQEMNQIKKRKKRANRKARLKNQQLQKSQKKDIQSSESQSQTKLQTKVQTKIETSAQTAQPLRKEAKQEIKSVKESSELQNQIKKVQQQIEKVIEPQIMQKQKHQESTKQIKEITEQYQVTKVNNTQEKLKVKSKDKGKKGGKNKPKYRQKKEESLQKIQQSVQKQEEFIKQKKISIDRQKQQSKKTKKVVIQRINQHIHYYNQQLCLASQSLDKYRKVCIQLIENTIAEINFKIKWELLLFGSYSIDFALRQSDLDIIVMVQDPEACSLHHIYDHFKVKQWLRGCNIIQIQSAKVNILEFQILLSHIKHPKLKDSKKMLNEVIHVDISITHNKETHQGIRNTTIMRNLFEENPNLKTICLIFKELLKIYQLNKPFLGGIGSFVLVILIHNILRIHNVGVNEDYRSQILLVCEYMTEKFQPFRTLISPYKHSLLAINTNIQLNIQDPYQKVLLNTTKVRQINEIILLFRQFHTLVSSIESQLLQVNILQKKKMKRLFFEQWNLLFKPKEEIKEQIKSL